MIYTPHIPLLPSPSRTDPGDFHIPVLPLTAIPAFVDDEPVVRITYGVIYAPASSGLADPLSAHDADPDMHEAEDGSLDNPFFYLRDLKETTEYVAVELTVSAFDYWRIDSSHIVRKDTMAELQVSSPTKAYLFLTTIKKTSGDSPQAIVASPQAFAGNATWRRISYSPEPPLSYDEFFPTIDSPTSWVGH